MFFVIYSKQNLTSGTAFVCEVCRVGHTIIFIRKKVMMINCLKQADINIHSDKGATTLFGACQQGHVDIVKMLLDKQADVNVQDVEGCTPLLIACYQGHKDIVKILLDKQADVNIQDVNGAMPLNIACHQGHEEISELLRQHGAM
jgi:ankyrin repeat protein